MNDPPVVPGFEVLEEIGRGSQARVYRARQDAMDRVVALKIIAGPSSDEGLRRTLRLFREARTLGALDHPGIVRGIDAGSTPECSWFAMEYVEGRTLGQIVGEDGPPPVARAVAVALDLLDALAHAHRRGVVHRDLKPGNILVDRNGRARLLDLGLARRDADPRQSLDGGALGTPRYMAPEQALTPETVDGRADLFSLASVLYYAISGQAPFGGRTVAEVLTRVLYEDPTPLASLRLDVPDALSAVVEKAMAKNPAHRFQDAQAFGAALRAAMRPGATPRSTGAARRPRPAVLATVCVACVLVAGAAWYGVRGRPAPPAPSPPAPIRTPNAGAAAPVDTVAALLPEAAPDIPPLERAQRACAAARNASFEPADLAACLAPLKADLEAAADRLLRNAVKIAQRGDAGSARDMVARAGEALLRELSPEGGEPPSPLRNLARDVAAKVPAGFERAYAIWQDDVAATAARELEALAAEAASTSWTPAEQSDRIAAITKDAAALEGAARERVERERERAARELRQAPVEGLRRRLKEAEALVHEGRLAAARKLLAPWEGGQGEDLVPGATASVRFVLDLADAKEAASAEKAAEAPDALARGDETSLGAAGRTLRVENFGRVVEAIGVAAAEAPRLKPEFDHLTALRAAAEAAARMRADLLVRLGAGPPAVDAIRLVTRRDGALSERRLVGREGGGVVLRKTTDGQTHVVDAEELAPACVAEALARYGVAPTPLATALLEHWDGDDAGALARLDGAGAALEPRARARVSALASAASETAAAKLPTAEERAALRALLAARRRRAEGDVRGAAEQVRPLAAGGKLRATTFWKRYGEEVERIMSRARSAEEREAKLRPFGSTARAFDRAKKSVRLTFDFRKDGVADGAAPPPGAVRDVDGLRWPGAVDAPAPAPERAPSLRIPAPPEAGATASSVRCEIEYDPSSPPPYLAATWFDATFLAFGALRDFRSFGGVPLHGLERTLIAAKEVDRALCVFGGPADARRKLPAEGAAIRSLGGKSTATFGFETADDGQPFGILEDARFPVRGVRPRPAGYAGLEIRLPPGVVLKHVVLEFPITAEEP
jgi:tRNA A-37 threonylcarbamoyl transferase component Bud32